VLDLGQHRGGLGRALACPQELRQVFAWGCVRRVKPVTPHDRQCVEARRQGSQTRQASQGIFHILAVHAHTVELCGHRWAPECPASGEERLLALLILRVRQRAEVHNGDLHLHGWLAEVQDACIEGKVHARWAGARCNGSDASA